MTREEAINILKELLDLVESPVLLTIDRGYALKMAFEALEQEPKTVTVKQLEEMYDKFQKKLWREHEDVRGDDMIEVGYAEQFLQELLMEFGCWDREVEG